MKKVGHFFLGEWQINPDANTLRNGKRATQIEPRAMEVLLCLLAYHGEVVSAETLLSECWPHSETGDNPLHKTINQLRRALGDQTSSPQYIETIRKRGYRLIAEVRYLAPTENDVTPASWCDGSPFPGLQAYHTDQAAVFFGRSQQTEDALNQINQQVLRGRDFFLLLGPSGCGKSSLLQAGILANLATKTGYNGVGVISHSTLDLADVAHDELLLSLASTLLDWEIDEQPVLLNESATSLAERLADAPEGVIEQLQQQLPLSELTCPRFGLIVDRLEVLLSSPLFNEAQRQQFLALVEQLASSGCVLILSACRNDFYPQLARYPTLMEGKTLGAHFDLMPPTRHELLQMVRLPAQAAGLKWQLDEDTSMPLDELLCGEAAAYPDALPMLQYTLQQLYLARDNDTMLVSVYHELGGIEGAIGKTAEDTLAQLTAPQQQSLPRILSLLVTMQEDETSITSRSARWEQLQNDDEHALVNAMVDRRLFVTQLQQGVSCFSIAHEALLRTWQRATHWITEHKQSLALSARLRQAARRWQQEQHSRAYLLAPGKPLLEALSLQQNPLFSLPDIEQQFIAASAQRSRHRCWLRNGTIALLAGLTLLAGTMSVRSFEAQKNATERRLAAENLLGFMMGDLADKLRGIGRMDLLDGVTKKAFEYFTDTSADDDADIGFAGQLQHAQTLEAMAEVAYSRGKTKEAKTTLLAARERFQYLLADHPHHLGLLKSAGANAFWLGQLAYDQSDWDTAEHYLSYYLQHAQAMVDIAPDDNDALMELSYATNSLGSVQMKRQDYSGAQKAFAQSLAVKKKLLLTDPNNMQLLGDMLDTESWLASPEITKASYPETLSKLERIFNSYKKYIRKNNYFDERFIAFNNNLYFYSTFLNKGKKASYYLDLSLKMTNLILDKDSKNDVWINSKAHLQLEKINLLINKKPNPKNNYKKYYSEILEKNKNKDNYNKDVQLFIGVTKGKLEYLLGLRNRSLITLENIKKQAISLVEKEDSFSYLRHLSEIYLTKANVERTSKPCRKLYRLLEKENKSLSSDFIVYYARAKSCSGQLDRKLITKLEQLKIPKNVYIFKIGN